MKPRRNKFGAVATVLDGIRFDSKREATVYAGLKVLERQGVIRDLKIHMRYDLHAPGLKRIGAYEADFVYYDPKEDRQRIIDVKGHDTELSKWKRRHVESQYGIAVEIVK